MQTDAEAGPEWNMSLHGPNVWVRIDPEGKPRTIRENSGTNSIESERWIWWPAKVHISTLPNSPDDGLTKTFVVG